jgi:hypothetical protein
MRKGSKKTDVISLDEFKELNTPVEQFIAPEIVDILLRICDACHEIDTRTEPWASIRKDIERLK